MKRVPLILLFLACIAPAPRTQDLDAIKQILAKVAEEMDEIDRLLRESSNTRAAAASMGETVSRIEQLLDQTQESQTTVVTEIDKLLEELNKLTNQQGQGQGQQQQQQQQQQQGRNQPRRQNPTPEMVRQRQQQQDQERNEQQDPPDGENLPPTQRPESGTETVEHSGAGAEWGTLPKYYLLLQRRGTENLVPEKYLQFLKAYLNKSNKDR